MLTFTLNCLYFTLYAMQQFLNYFEQLEGGINISKILVKTNALVKITTNHPLNITI